VARQLWTLTGRELSRVQDRILLLIKTAQERVAGFLLEMADRASKDGAVELPMSRQRLWMSANVRRFRAHTPAGAIRCRR
jgi:CRP-like cAMP-binding protein